MPHATARPPSPRRPLPSGGAARGVGLPLLLALALAPAVSGCDRADAPAAPPPQAQRADTLPGGREGERADPAADGAAAVATWTVPRPGAPGGAGQGTPLAPAGALPGAGALPRPTAAPAAAPALAPPPPDGALLGLMGAVSAARLSSDVARLAGFGTRHTLSPTGDATRGVAAARTWITERFATAARGATAQLTVEEEPFPLQLGGVATTQRNVLATLTGIGRVKRLVYLTAHYDSRAEDVLDGLSDAPGADDNASGVAALLELARVLGTREWDGSIRLAALAAEEQGMHGSRHHAPLARQIGLPIVGVLNLDIVGGGPDDAGRVVADAVRAYSAEPDDGPSRALARWARFVAERYGALRVEVMPTSDRAGRASDHQSFDAAGFRALRLISAVEDTTRQHTGRDTPERLDAAYHAAVVRLAVALAGNLALAPPAAPAAPAVGPDASSPSDLRVTWPALDDEVVAGYWVAVRAPGAPAFEAVLWEPAGPAPSLVLAGMAGGGPLHVAVAAGDALGHVGQFGPDGRFAP